MNILIVDDDLVSQKIVSQVLSKWNIDVAIAGDGAEAINKLQQSTFNLVLMDLHMPMVDGIEAMTRIRNHEREEVRALPVIAYTASSMGDTREKVEKYGMNDVVGKPLDPVALHCKIMEHATSAHIGARPLRLKYNLYPTSDPEFRTELMQLMIRNLRELQEASFKSYYAQDARPFTIIAHKIKSTIVLLDDREFSFLIEEVKSALSRGLKPVELQDRISSLGNYCESLIRTLYQECMVPASC